MSFEYMDFEVMDALAIKSTMEGTDFWFSCFRFPDWSANHRKGVVDMMTVSTSDIYSGKLQNARTFFRQVENGSLSIIRSSPDPFTFMDALQVLSIIGTFSRIARVQDVRMRNGAWLKPRAPEGVYVDKSPIMPFGDLERATGLDEITLRAILHPFMRDLAIGIVPKVGSGSGVVLRDGFIDDDGIRRMQIH